jgi:hypothetical protein
MQVVTAVELRGVNKWIGGVRGRSGKINDTVECATPSEIVYLLANRFARRSPIESSALGATALLLESLRARRRQ